MKRLGFEYEVGAVIEISGEELDVLRACSECHYDSKCRKAFEPGGFGWGWLVLADGPEDRARRAAGTAKAEASFRDLDTCAKILEVVPPDVDRAVAVQLRLAMTQAMRDLNSEAKRLSEWKKMTSTSVQGA